MTLSNVLKDRILSREKIPFAEFMEVALFYPSLGYYSSERVKIGKAGDYFTSTSVHQVFGELICKQIEEMWRITGSASFFIVEMGAGDGTLCFDILNAATERYPSFFEMLQYLIIEESEGLRKVQKERLNNGGYCEGDKVRWTDISDPVFHDGLIGCVLSNELVDAFPVHIVEKRDGKLKEVYVSMTDDAFTEVLDTLSSPEIEGYFDRLGIELQEGQRAEVNLRAIEWMKWVARSLNTGFAITIDYGYTSEELYAPERSRGTFLCYYKHQVVEDPLINIGEQDMTSHVDFTTLMMTGEGCGLMTAGFTDQMHFLFGLGIGKSIEEISEKTSTETDALNARLLIKNLIMPGRMGNVFKVLVQYKGFDTVPELSGLNKNPFA
ncbi:MAG: SAM-dependent methyltransferase [Nitrospirae bacterium]|nr:SAM-dependent methyltransferase [Nitrospirota bacterium]